MSNIQPEVNDILNARYGEEVRGSIVTALEKVNQDNESYSDMKEEMRNLYDALTDYKEITIPADGWANNSQIITVEGVKSDESAQLIEVMSAKENVTEYKDCNVLCVAQGENSLTFNCDTVPENDLKAYIFIRTISDDSIYVKKKYIDIGSAENIFDVREGDEIVRSEVIKNQNVIYCSIVMKLGSDIELGGDILTFKDVVPYGEVKPKYSFDFLTLYASTVKSIYCNAERGTFTNPYGNIDHDANSHLRFQVEWVVEE